MEKGDTEQKDTMRLIFYAIILIALCCSAEGIGYPTTDKAKDIPVPLFMPSIYLEGGLGFCIATSSQNIVKDEILSGMSGGITEKLIFEPNPYFGVTLGKYQIFYGDDPIDMMTEEVGIICDGFSCRTRPYISGDMFGVNLYYPLSNTLHGKKEGSMVRVPAYLGYIRGKLKLRYQESKVVSRCDPCGGKVTGRKWSTLNKILLAKSDGYYIGSGIQGNIEFQGHRGITISSNLVFHNIAEGFVLDSGAVLPGQSWVNINIAMGFFIHF